MKSFYNYLVEDCQISEKKADFICNKVAKNETLNFEYGYDFFMYNILCLKEEYPYGIPENEEVKLKIVIK